MNDAEWSTVKNMKILLVDDDYLALEGLQQMLHWKEFDGELIGCATNGTEAISIIKKSCPDVVISDIKMPGMDGLELTKYLYENYRGIRMILISGHGEFDYAQRALQYQVVDYILKPITRKKITDLEKRLAGIKRELDPQKDNYWYMYDETLREQVLAALRKGDMAFLGELMISEKVMESLSIDRHDALGLQLLNYLFIYQEEIGKDKPSLSALKQQAMEEYWQLSSPYARIAYLSKRYYDLMEYAENCKNQYIDPIVAYSVQMIQEHFSDPYFNISSIAEAVHLSLPYLSTIFKQATGQNISNYLARQRLNEAKTLLRDVSIPIKDVSKRSGYEDPRYFAKIFKKRTGMTPSEFRNLYSSGHQDVSMFSGGNQP